MPTVKSTLRGAKSIYLKLLIYNTEGRVLCEGYSLAPSIHSRVSPLAHTYTFQTILKSTELEASKTSAYLYYSYMVDKKIIQVI